MRHPKLNLSFYSQWLLLLCLLFPQIVFGQSRIVNVLIRGDKAERTPTIIAYPVISNNPHSQQRNFIINSLTLTINTFGSTCNASNGSIIAVATGGTAPYTYTLSNGWVLQSGNFPSLAPGTYTLTATDANGQTVNGTATITNTFAPITFAPFTYQPVSSCAANDGSVSLSANGGTPPYQYSMDGVNYQAGNTFSNLYSGMYNFFVKDANGCTIVYNSFNMNFLFASSCENSMGLTYTDQVCGNEGFITGQALGPNGPYLYSLDGVNYQSTLNYSNLVAGLYTIYIKAANGTIRIVAISMRPNCNIRIDYVTVDAACQQNDGVLTATASNGTAPYTYSLDGINFQTSNVFPGLSPGNYFITVKDANGYTSSAYVVVFDRCPAVSLSATGETCAQNDGTITATATKGTAPYQYSIDGVNFQTSNVFPGLDAGPYTITLKDALGFTATASIVVPNACLTVFAISSNATCNNNNGSITASASNGTAPYQYSLDGINFQVSGNFVGLAPGPYTVTAKDINGKIGNTTVSVSGTPVPQLTVAAQPAFCGNNDGTITITGTGGTAPLQYSITGTTYQNANVFSNLAAGPYTAWVKDATGCQASQPVTIVFNCPGIALNWTDETCGNANATITVTASGATPPYLYSIDGTNYQSSNVFPGISTGVYTAFVKDALGSVNSATATINNVCPTVTATVTNGLCGTANASIIATGANGTTPYQYSIDGINFQTSNSFANLITGPYTITVKDANGLTNTVTATVQNFPGPILSVINTPASCLDNDGNITINTAGGTAPFQYSINGTNFLSNHVFNGVANGNYTATVKDANGCVAAQPVAISTLNNLSFVPGINPTICEGNNTTFNAASNGNNFAWTPAASLINSNQLNPTASPATTTKYYVTVSLGTCSKTDSVTVFVNPAPIADAGQVEPICFGQDAQLNGVGGEIYIWYPVTYLSDSHIPNPIVMHPPSSVTYSLDVIDANNCRSLQSSTVTITVTPAAKVFAGNDTAIVMNKPFMLMAKDINNSGFVQYTWSPPNGLSSDISQNPIAILDRDMTYTVTATTQQGCQGTDEIKIKVYKGPEIYVPTAFTPNKDGHNDILKAIPVGIKAFKYFTVYNRWGQQVFYTIDANQGWDGRLRGIEQDTNTFVWLAEGTDDNGNMIRRKGTVTLIR